MERKLHEPLTLPKHPELLHEINEMSIAIKLHHLSAQENPQNKIIAAKVRVNSPEWGDIVELLRKCYKAVDEQRETLKKY